MFGLSRPDFEQKWGTRYERPGIRSKILAIVLRIIPKIGPFSGLAFKTPTPEAEALFVKSFATTVDRYREALQSASRATPELENLNFDIGKPVRAGEYRRADEAYESLLDKLQEHDFQRVSPALRAHLVGFFSDFPQTVASRKDQKRWQKLQSKVSQLKASPAN
jgi:hypothetical protein